jgi:hypothetical protein
MSELAPVGNRNGPLRCRPCRNARSRPYEIAWRKANPERVREIHRNSKRRRGHKPWSGSNREMARTILNREVKAGRIVKPTKCSRCGKPAPPNRIHGHHDDYDKPLEVRWLCPPCHALAHGGHYGKALDRLAKLAEAQR